MTDEEMAVNWIRSQGWSEETLPVELIAFWSGICLWGCLNFARDLIRSKKEKESMCKFWDLVTGENNIWKDGGENQDDKI